VGSVPIKGVETSPHPSSKLSDRVVGVDVNMLIHDRSPKPFDKHVAHPSAFTIHADLNAVGPQDAGEGIACELTALIGVKNFRSASHALAKNQALHLCNVFKFPEPLLTSSATSIWASRLIGLHTQARYKTVAFTH
jgi:hypothetical protein